ncbi:glycoside hydrolase family 1 [Verrucomicrobia bacterium IMCC26134]|nr:glycoside hydrolase family 1 [Verrucomicrobia bacterium IMCC26134]
MSSRANAILSATLETPSCGVIELLHDWRARSVPVLVLSGGMRMRTLERYPTERFALHSGYHVLKDGTIEFVFDPANHPELDVTTERVHIAGEFNGWVGADRAEWAMVPKILEGKPVLSWVGPLDKITGVGGGPVRFKFVTAKHIWLSVPLGTPNARRDDAGNFNRVVEPERTGLHLFSFELESPADLSQTLTVSWASRHAGDAVPLHAGAFFYALQTELPLGVDARASGTRFRIFAPRASRVELALCAALAEQGKAHRYALTRRQDEDGAAGVWEVTLEGNLHGWYYWYHVDGPKDAFGAFDPSRRVLDPYAVAVVGREGPGIIFERARLGMVGDGFKTPAWHDLVIAEAHVRDLAQCAPVTADDGQRRGFAGLKKWVESEDFYLSRLGVNCVELQPLQEFDNQAREDYHWGYMTVNWFAPASAYASRPEAATGLRELQELVRAFHERGIAVIVDVVYNHVGEPAHLMFLDRLYYFEQDISGNLSNWSGCGNDYRASAAMAQRLIIDSCTHWLKVFGVDGFRFDLADLIGRPVLERVEAALKKVKPDVILIAEPWSFRGHIAGELRDTGWSSWNDGYRNFMRDFVRGAALPETFEYYLKGSPWYYAKWPAQTVNYTESHDDRTWIDVITENGDGDGHLPTVNDRRRTHLMAAVLFCSIGIPMVSAGQDYLRSKHGVNNTYLRGDLNALDYQRIHRFPSTHAYFADWIAFRRSETGHLLRHFSRATEGFFEFIRGEGPSIAVIYNADLSQGAERLLFAINPGLADATIPLSAWAINEWHQVADAERFLAPGRPAGTQRVTENLFVPALGFGLWRMG